MRPAYNLTVTQLHAHRPVRRRHRPLGEPDARAREGSVGRRELAVAVCRPDPTSRQFTTTDPVGPRLGSPTISTPYHYGDNDPINMVDPLGLSPQDRNPMDDEWNFDAANDTVTSADISCDTGIRSNHLWTSGVATSRRRLGLRERGGSVHPTFRPRISPRSDCRCRTGRTRTPNP